MQTIHSNCLKLKWGFIISHTTNARTRIRQKDMPNASIRALAFYLRLKN
jgi:hypothetical protein